MQQLAVRTKVNIQHHGKIIFKFQIKTISLLDIFSIMPEHAVYPRSNWMKASATAFSRFERVRAIHNVLLIRNPWIFMW